MASYRLARVLRQLSDGDGNGDGMTSTRLCEVAADVVGVSGAGVMLMSADVPKGTLCATNDVSSLIEELQYGLGEGPCVDAHHESRVVLEPDLAASSARRWFAFAPRAVEAGAAAMFAFPLRVGRARLGALDLYRDTPGPLTDDQHVDALAMADVIARWVLDVQADAPAGAVAGELQLGSDFHFIVHNAAGAASVQLGVDIAEALVRLRAYAFSHDRLLRDVAEDVVARRLRLP